VLAGCRLRPEVLELGGQVAPRALSPIEDIHALATYPVDVAICPVGGAVVAVWVMGWMERFEGGKQCWELALRP